ncbi:Ubiquitin carboxyl-terminal hydrolase 5 [Taenia solium]|eukprot:TsM_000370200 transcript=TsM_000370200 gene=TsM_000370200
MPRAVVGFVGVDSLVSEPKRGRRILKDGRTFSFVALADKNGLFACMRAFLGVGSGLIDKCARRTRNPVFLRCKIVKVFKTKGPEDGIESAKPKGRAVGVSDGFEFPQDKYAFSKKWRLRRYPGRHSLDVPCPSRNSVVADVSHLEGVGLSIRVEPCINGVQLCDGHSFGACASAVWEAGDARPVSKVALSLAQLNGGVIVSLRLMHSCVCSQVRDLFVKSTDEALFSTLDTERLVYDDEFVDEPYRWADLLRSKALRRWMTGWLEERGAEAFSYAEDGMVTDLLLAQHLAHLGINMQHQRKTDRTAMEMEALALPSFVESAVDAVVHSGIATAAVEFFGLQRSKVDQALCSGVYSFPAEELGNTKGGEVVPKQPGEFGSDVQEFLVHLFNLVEREMGEKWTVGTASPLHSLSFVVEDHIQSGLTGEVRKKERMETIVCLLIALEAATSTDEVAAYEKRKSEAEKKKKTPLKEDPVYLKIGIDACLSAWAGQEPVRDFISPVIDPPGRRMTAPRSCRLVAFTKILCVQLLKLIVAIEVDANSAVDGRPQCGWRLELSGLRARVAQIYKDRRSTPVSCLHRQVANAAETTLPVPCIAVSTKWPPSLSTIIYHVPSDTFLLPVCSAHAGQCALSVKSLVACVVSCWDNVHQLFQQEAVLSDRPNETL